MVSPRAMPLALGRGDYNELRRVHVTNPTEWAHSAGTDFWIVAGGNGWLGTGNAQELADYGWTTTSLAVADGSGADFMSKDDPGTPGAITTNDAADLLQSPSIFGNYAHAHQAAALMGHKELPRYLVMDAYAQFSVHSADELTTNIGFVEDGGSIVTSADIMAGIYTDSSVWAIQAGGTEAKGSASDDANWHWFRILMDKQNDLSYGYVDGTLINSVAITADEFPVAFGFGNGTTNRIQFSQAHIFYSWLLPYDPEFF